MELSSIPISAQTAILALLCLGHAIALLLYLTNFPLRLTVIQSNLSKSINNLPQVIHLGRKKQADEESIPDPVTQEPQNQPPFSSQTLRPRWPFLSSVSSILSPRSSVQDSSKTPTPSARSTSVQQKTFSSMHAKTRTPKSIRTPLTANNAESDTAYTTSVSLSPYPTVTPTPIRRFMRADALYSPSIYPPLSTVKMNKGVEMLSPSIYSPLPLNVRKRGGMVELKRKEMDGCGDATAGAAREVCGERFVVSSDKAQNMLTPGARPVRPGRYFDPKRQFETITPESLERGSIVIGLGGGLSPLVGTDAASGKPISVDGLGDKLGHVAAGDGGSSVYSRPPAGKALPDRHKERLELERFATPLTDEDAEEIDRKSHRYPDMVREQKHPVFLLGFMDRTVAGIASLLANMLDGGSFSDAEKDLLVKTGDLSVFLFDN